MLYEPRRSPGFYSVIRDPPIGLCNLEAALHLPSYLLSECTDLHAVHCPFLLYPHIFLHGKGFLLLNIFIFSASKHISIQCQVFSGRCRCLSYYEILRLLHIKGILSNHFLTDIRSPGNKLFNNPQFSVKYTCTIVTWPPHALEMKEVTPCGAIPMRNFIVLCCYSCSRFVLQVLSLQVFQ